MNYNVWKIQNPGAARCLEFEGSCSIRAENATEKPNWVTPALRHYCGYCSGNVNKGLVARISYKYVEREEKTKTEKQPRYK
jgi:hypothetical protein